MLTDGMGPGAKRLDRSAEDRYPSFDEQADIICDLFAWPAAQGTIAGRMRMGGN
jgi:hypothetical protein